MTLDRSIGPRCNIGPDEVARRRTSAWFFTGLAAVVAIVLVALDVPPLARLIVWPFAAGAAVNWLQVTNRFCVHYGLFGMENFGRIGEAVEVDPAQRASDRRKVLEMAIQGIVVGLVVAIALVALPV